MYFKGYVMKYIQKINIYMYLLWGVYFKYIKIHLNTLFYFWEVMLFVCVKRKRVLSPNSPLFFEYQQT